MKTYERVKIAKSYIEKKYKIKKSDEEMKKKEWEEIYKKLEVFSLTPEENERFKEILLKQEAEYIRESRQKNSIYQFDSLAIIGRGAFGEVRICKDKETGEILAVKKMKKTEMHKKNQVLHVKAEQEVLAKSNSEWIVELKYSFQDHDYLYLVMEFLPGGDLMSLLMSNDILPEEQAKLYAAEMVLAIEDIHKLKCIHRDIKPDNVLIGADGHIKLSDFGLSRQADSDLYQDNPIELKNAYSHIPGISNIAAKYADHFNNRMRKRIFAFSTVGTPDYIAPEVFSQTGYGPEVDWWSLGVILFEMMVGFPPFFSDSPTETCKKIMNWKQYLKFPPESNISPESKDLIRKLVTDVDKRIGYESADEIKRHPFFANIDWKNIKKHKPLFVPEIKSKTDTSYFDKFDEEEPFYPPKEDCAKQISKDICFIDFDFERDQKKKSLVALLDNEHFVKTTLQTVLKDKQANPVRKPSTIIQDNIQSTNQVNEFANNTLLSNLNNIGTNFISKTPKDNKNINFSKYINLQGSGPKDLIDQPQQQQNLTANNLNKINTMIVQKKDELHKRNIPQTTIGNNNQGFSSFHNTNSNTNSNSNQPTYIKQDTNNQVKSSLKGKLQLKLDDNDDIFKDNHKLNTMTNVYVSKNNAINKADSLNISSEGKEQLIGIKKNNLAISSTKGSDTPSGTTNRISIKVSFFFRKTCNYN